MTSDPGHVRGALLVVCAGSLWSFNGIIIRLMQEATGWQILFWRALFLALFLLVFLAWRQRGRWAELAGSIRLPAVVGGIVHMISFICLVFAFLNTSVASALLIASSAPFWAALLAWLLLRERVPGATWLGMVVAMAGITMMMGEGAAENRVIGALFALGVAIFYGAFAVVLRWGRSLSLDMYPAVLLAGIFNTVFSAGMLWTEGTTIWVPFNDIALNALSGIVLAGMGLVLYTAGSRHVRAAELTLLALSEVVLGPLWVWLFMGEETTPMTLAGGTLVIAAILFVAFMRPLVRVPAQAP